jgi:hypothetical protein
VLVAKTEDGVQRESPNDHDLRTLRALARIVSILRRLREKAAAGKDSRAPQGDRPATES